MEEVPRMMGSLRCAHESLYSREAKAFLFIIFIVQVAINVQFVTAGDGQPENSGIVLRMLINVWHF